MGKKTPSEVSWNEGEIRKMAYPTSGKTEVAYFASDFVSLRTCACAHVPVFTYVRAYFRVRAESLISEFVYERPSGQEFYYMALTILPLGMPKTL